MKWIYTLVVGGMCGALVIGMPQKASAEVTVAGAESERAALLERIVELKAELERLQGKTSGIRVALVPLWDGEERNISLSSIRLVRKDEDTSHGETLVIRVASGKEGFPRITGEHAQYEVYLYEVRGSRELKVSSDPVSEGRFLVPYARGTVEFRAKLDESIFEDLAAGTEVRAEVYIDADRQIKETNERDNKKMSPVWTLE